MKGKQFLCENPIPDLVNLSKSYSNVSVNIAYIPKPQEYKKMGEMNFEELSNFINELLEAQKPNKSFKEALKFTITKGSLLYSIMQQQNINTIELGKAIGVSGVSVSRWVNNSANITKENLKKLADYFGTTPDYLSGKDSRPTPEEEADQKTCILFTKQQLKNFGISNLDKEILKECGYYLIDPYINDEYYTEKVELATITENQTINENEWITWVYTIGYFNKFPSQIALVKTSYLEEMGVDYLDHEIPIDYSEETKNIAQYVDYDKLKLLLGDRKRQLAFNFDMSLESIK